VAGLRSRAALKGILVTVEPSRSGSISKKTTGLRVEPTAAVLYPAALNLGGVTSKTFLKLTTVLPRRTAAEKLHVVSQSC